jgi:predicted negative regulator of RcsB-dependent stress response
MDNASEDYQTFYKILAESQIKEFEANINNLTAEQKSLLKSAKESFDVSDYSRAVETLYQIQPTE